mmetsp:Transcript_11494/g.40092  ORF Transcript_11494/g.40092 Transcript_11494/m.40092 type:complete len:269 (-) Transcript_11494:433-1239(-)
MSTAGTGPPAPPNAPPTAPPSEPTWSPTLPPMLLPVDEISPSSVPSGAHTRTAAAARSTASTRRSTASTSSRLRPGHSCCTGSCGPSSCRGTHPSGAMRPDDTNTRFGLGSFDPTRVRSGSTSTVSCSPAPKADSTRPTIHDVGSALFSSSSSRPTVVGASQCTKSPSRSDAGSQESGSGVFELTPASRLRAASTMVGSSPARSMVGLIRDGLPPTPLPAATASSASSSASLPPTPASRSGGGSACSCQEQCPYWPGSRCCGNVSGCP